MAKYDQTETVQSLGPHRDYETNLSQANRFCSNIKKSLLAGMSVKIADSQGLKNSLLHISFIPERTEKIGNFVTPISLHQASSEFNKKIESIFNSYISMVKSYRDRKQLDLIETSSG